MKRARNISEENETKFSFADFQRDIQLKNSIFKRQVVDKLKDFTEKYRNKEKELIEYLEQKEQEVKLQRAKSKKICEAEVQTDLNFNIFMDAHEQRVKDLEEKCLKLEYIRKTHF
jgi:predicted ATPase